MSQLIQNSAEPNAENGGVWLKLLDNLSLFITSATTLTESLKQAIDTSKQQAIEFQEEESEWQDLTESEENKEPKCNCKEPKTPPSAKKTSLRCKTMKKPQKESFEKEKSEKLVVLKENLKTAQQNLVDIQEQVRQLERLYEDYDSLNTPSGHVNPAALYKEIMKPHSVPYVPATKKILPKQISQKSVSCHPCPKMKKQQQKTVEAQLSVLSTVPYAQRYLNPC